MNRKHRISQVLREFNLTEQPLLLPGGSTQAFRVGNAVLKRIRETSLENNHSLILIQWIADFSLRLHEDGFYVPKLLPTVDNTWITPDFYAVSEVVGISAVYACVISDCVEGPNWEDGFIRARQSIGLLQDLIIAIEVQKGLFEKSILIYNAGKLLENISFLIDRAHRVNVPVFFIQHTNERILTEGIDEWRFHPQIQALDTDFIIQRSHASAFKQTVLKNELDSRYTQRLVVTGLVTHGCV